MGSNGRVFIAERRERRKAVPGYGGRYEVGDLGRVYSRGFEMARIRGRYVKLCERGRVDLVDVAYLVARAFLPNTECRPYVVRLDGDWSNCRVENLAWSEERDAGRRRGRKPERTEQVMQYTMDGRLVCVYADVVEACERSGVSRQLIRGCCIGRTKSAGGFRWRYL